MHTRSRTPRHRLSTALIEAAGPCSGCSKDCAGCVFAERAAEARAEGDDAAVRRAMDQMARRGCRRLAVSARSKGGFSRRLATGAAAAALVLSLGLAGCETEPGGKTDTFGIDASEVFEVAILPADVAGGDSTPEIWVIMPPPDTLEETTPDIVIMPQCVTDSDCDDPLFSCVDGQCEQTMFPVMPQCQADTDCAENEVCQDGACEPVVAILPACTTNDDCQLHEMCVNGECKPAISILPACVSDEDCQPTEVCADGYCQPVISILPACVGDDDCNTPIEACINGQCEQVMWPVMPQCMADDDCAVGEVCVNNTCQPEAVPCASDADCPAGQVCEGECPDETGEVFCVVPQMGACVPKLEPTTCQSDADCAPGEVCDLSSGCPEGMYCILPIGGTCVPKEEPIACSADADCPVGQTCEGECPTEDGRVMCILPVMGVCTEKTNPAHCTTDDDCVPGDVCVGGCPEGMFCILPMDSVCKTECATDADCEAGEACYGAQTCPPDQVCILPDQKGLCESAMFAILPPAPLPVAPPAPGKAEGAKTSAAAWRAYVEGAIAWFRPANDKTGRS